MAVERGGRTSKTPAGTWTSPKRRNHGEAAAIRLFLGNYGKEKRVTSGGEGGGCPIGGGRAVAVGGPVGRRSRGGVRKAVGGGGVGGADGGRQVARTGISGRMTGDGQGHTWRSRRAACSGRSSHCGTRWTCWGAVAERRSSRTGRMSSPGRTATSSEFMCFRYSRTFCSTFVTTARTCRRQQLLAITTHWRNTKQRRIAEETDSETWSERWQGGTIQTSVRVENVGR